MVDDSRILEGMTILTKTMLVAGAVLVGGLWSTQLRGDDHEKPAMMGPEYTADGQLRFPSNYREWVFLSSGSGMTYGPAAASGRNRPVLFDNVFVNPAAYRAFLQSGHWPDKTMFVLEIRNSESHASINNGGHFQRDIVGIEAEVKDAKAGSGEWTFYGFPESAATKSAPGTPFPRTASCYSCHGKNTAVENTFVQFYPQLYEIAVRKGTLNQGFKELPLTMTELTNLLNDGGWEKASAALNGIRVSAPDANVISEGTLNVLGNQMMQRKPQVAVNLLRWATEQYPGSANLQDSLADAYLKAGDKARAKAATVRSQELLDHDPKVDASSRKAFIDGAQKRLKSINE